MYAQWSSAEPVEFDLTTTVLNHGMVIRSLKLAEIVEENDDYQYLWVVLLRLLKIVHCHLKKRKKETLCKNPSISLPKIFEVKAYNLFEDI